MHRLLQSLPDIAAEHRREAARQFFARRARDSTDAECATMAEQACGLLEHRGFSELFGSFG